MNNGTSPSGGCQGRHGNEENRPIGIYGDHIKQKRSGMVRILFQNPQGLGHLAGGNNTLTPKLKKLRDTLIKHKIDIVGLAEVNKDWRKIPQKDTMWDITAGWFEYRRMTTSINNMVHATSPVQYGGTLLMATDQLAYSITSTASDKRQLGRWSTVLCRGKKQTKLRIICAYCPCRSTGTTSTYALQVVGLAKSNIMECPRKHFWIDLKRYIQKCQLDGEQVLVMGDWNSKYQEVVL
jgi:Endonuclease/Exonuclease/phosphatase family.